MKPNTEGLRKAGLSIPESDDRPARRVAQRQIRGKLGRAKPRSTLERSGLDEGFWVAVLPFKYSGSNSDLTTLAEGLTEEIVTGL